MPTAHNHKLCYHGIWRQERKHTSSTNMAKKQDNYLYNCDQVRALDRLAIDRNNISGLQLMQRAGMVVFKHILKHYCKHAITVFCGSGNNGGDGYVIATLAKEKGIAVQLIHLKHQIEGIEVS